MSTDVEQSVRIANEGDDTLRLQYADTLITLAPGQSRFVPFDVMVAWMGHPDLRNGEYDAWRTEAYENLALFYGALTLDGVDRTLLPALAAYDEDDNRISTILDDPEGASLGVAAATRNPSGHGDAEILARKVERLEAMLDSAGIVDPARPIPSDPSTPPPVDTPSTVKPKTRKKPVKKAVERIEVQDSGDVPAGPITDSLPPADDPDIVKIG